MTAAFFAKDCMNSVIWRIGTKRDKIQRNSLQFRRTAALLTKECFWASDAASARSAALHLVPLLRKTLSCFQRRWEYLFSWFLYDFRNWVMEKMQKVFPAYEGELEGLIILGTNYVVFSEINVILWFTFVWMEINLWIELKFLRKSQIQRVWSPGLLLYDIQLHWLIYKTDI